MDRRILLAAIGIGCLLVYPLFFQGSFAQHMMIMVFMYGALSLAWDIIGGHAHLFSFGQAAFFGVGAYTSTMLYMRLGLTPWVGMFAGGLNAVILGVIVGFPTSKLRGHYFAIATLALTFVMETFFTNWAFIGGAQGLSLPVVNENSWFHLQFHKSKTGYYYTMLGLLVLTIVMTWLLIRSWIGYYLRAFREAPDVAESLGANNMLYRLIAIAVSAFFTGMVGSVYAQYVLYIDPPSVMGIDLSIRVVLIAVFGGTGTLWGPVIGAALLVPFMELSRVWLGGFGRGLDHMLVGLLVIILCLLQPDGVIKLLAEPTRRLILGNSRKGAKVNGAA
jgi:branched-chain amino acid transport system permease protein